MPYLDLTDPETDALATLLTRTIDRDHYFLSQRVQTLKAILSKRRPQPRAPSSIQNNFAS